MLSYLKGLSFAFVVVTLSTLTCQVVSANTHSVFEVRKSLPLTNDEPVYKDYYLSAGAREGLKVGMLIDVVRAVPLHDHNKNQARGSLQLTIAKLKIIHVQRDLSVARLYSTASAKNQPVPDYSSIMIGDQIDIQSAAYPVRQKKKRNVSSVKKRTKMQRTAEPVELAVPEMPIPAPPGEPMIKTRARMMPTPLSVPVSKDQKSTPANVLR